MCVKKMTAPRYWERHVPIAEPIIPILGGPRTRYRLMNTFKVPVITETFRGVLLSLEPKLAAVPTTVTNVAGKATDRMCKY